MEYRRLGRTGIQVSVACMGTMTFGWEPDDWGSDEAASLKIAAKALDLGINFFDTADVYAQGLSETITGKALKGKRDQIVLATKCHFPMGDGLNDRGNSRRHIIAACEASLRRLQNDWIDLYQIHRPDPHVPIDETLRALDDLVRSGKVRYLGCSTFAGWQAAEAHYVARSLGTAGFVSEQPPYNLLDRRIERELLPFCRTYDWAVLPWSPMAGGILSGRYLDDKDKAGRYSKSDPAGRVKQAPKSKLVRFRALAQRSRLSMGELALAWVANQAGVTSPIIGARSIEQLESAVRACQTKLTERQLQAIDVIFPPGTNHLDYYRVPTEPGLRPYA
ncbi:MAG: Aldo-keto reductase YhdN [Fimbriimonadaceae bacterium]|nr:Aldo-keto reductase YhdN [Fimbriimonadaceae bacterium]